MNDQLDQTILEMVRTYLRSLSDSDFLALTCNQTQEITKSDKFHPKYLHI